MDGQETNETGITHTQADDYAAADTASHDAAQHDTSSTFFSRIGKWFKREHANGDLPLMRDTNQLVHQGHPVEGRGTFLRPWAKQTQMLNQLSEGFTTLTELMESIRDGLAQQNQRQGELIDHLKHLPQVLEQIPEGNRVHTETLRAIHEQIGQQNHQQTKLAEILDKISEGDSDQRKMIDSVRDRIESIDEHEQSIATNLSSMGNVMQGFSRSSETSTKVLEQLRDNITARDAELERVLHRQGTRFTTLLAIAIFLSVSAMAAVGVFGWLAYQAIQKMQ